MRFEPYKYYNAIQLWTLYSCVYSLSLCSVPCESDAFLACDSEWTYCLQQRVTRRAECVSSCLSRNGNCAEDSICITTVSENQRPTLQCLERDGECHLTSLTPPLTPPFPTIKNLHCILHSMTNRVSCFQSYLQNALLVW